MVGGNGRNAFFYTVEVSFFSALVLLLTQLLTSLGAIVRRISWDSKTKKNNHAASNSQVACSLSSMRPLFSWRLLQYVVAYAIYY
jgi:hypothetical protein